MSPTGLGAGLNIPTFGADLQNDRTRPDRGSSVKRRRVGSSTVSVPTKKIYAIMGTMLGASWVLRDNDAENLVRLSIGIEALATAFARRLEAPRAFSSLLILVVRYQAGFRFEDVVRRLSYYL